MHYSYPLTSTKNDNFVTIQETSPDDDSTKPQQQSRSPRRFGEFLRGWIWRLFPWIGEPPPQHLDDLHKQPSFPWLGLICLLTALLTLVCSWAVFFSIKNKPQIDNKLLKPASWLSAIISVNSIVLHIALAEGVTTAWWYKAQRTDVTLRELHEIYTMGTSTVSVLLAGKKFNYVAMGTIFVATVPLNGFLLQNAITLIPGTCGKNTTLSLPLVQRLPLGFSAQMENGTLGIQSDALVTTTSSMDGLTDLPAGAFYGDFYDFVSIGCTNKNNTAVCTSDVILTGFNMTCTTQWDKYYDLRPRSHANVSAYSETVFSSQVLWNSSNPNSIGLDVFYKPRQTCNGQFLRKICELRAANVTYPIQVNSDSGFYPGSNLEDLGYASSRPVVTLNSSATIANLSAQALLPEYPNEGEQNSTFGGIAKWLGKRFNGTIDWTYKNGSWSANTSGLIAPTYQFFQHLQPDNTTEFNDTTKFNPKHDNESWCENVYSGLDWYTEIGWDSSDSVSSYQMMNPVNTTFVTLHRMMLGASVSQAQVQWNQVADEWSVDTTSNVTWEEAYRNRWGYDEFITLNGSRQNEACLRYDIRWGYYAASVAITVSIVLMVAPLFYGFWTLDRRGTLSPFETAAAFGAPALQDADLKKGTGVLLKEIGKRPAHATTSTTSLPLPQRTADPTVR